MLESTHLRLHPLLALLHNFCGKLIVFLQHLRCCFRNEVYLHTRGFLKADIFLTPANGVELLDQSIHRHQHGSCQQSGNTQYDHKGRQHQRKYKDTVCAAQLLYTVQRHNT